MTENNEQFPYESPSSVSAEDTFVAQTNTNEASAGSNTPQTNTYAAPVSSPAAPTNAYEPPTRINAPQTPTYAPQTTTYEAPTTTYEAQTSTYAPQTNTYDAPQTTTYEPPTNTYEPQTDTFEAQPQKLEPALTQKRIFLTAFLGALVACVVCFGGYSLLSHFGILGGTTVTIGSGSSSATITVEGEDATLAEVVAQKSLPSVVAIDVYTKQSAVSYNYYGFSMGNNSSSDASTLTQSSLGSGVVLTEDGYIITNYHVIEGADALVVTVEGETYDAEVIGYDSSSDLAVIKAENASGLTPMDIADSDSLRIGQWVMSIGSPFGYEQSVATGVVSATSRSQVVSDETTGETTVYTNLIQTDAAINPGNSGGALVNSNGALIGINTLISSYSGNYSGVGFAIPSNYAISIAEKLIKGEAPTHATLGVSLSTVTSSIAQRYGLKASSGAYIAAVASGSGAAKAGLEVGDIIVEFNGKAVESASDVMIDVRECNPGDTVKVKINRDGSTEEVSVTLGESESSQSSSSSSSTQQQNSTSPFGYLSR